MDKINEELDALNVPRELPPIDGLVVAGLVYYLSPKEDKLKNTLIVSGAHFVTHELIVQRIKYYTRKDHHTNHSEKLVTFETKHHGLGV